MIGILADNAHNDIIFGYLVVGIIFAENTTWSLSIGWFQTVRKSLWTKLQLIYHKIKVIQIILQTNLDEVLCISLKNGDRHKCLRRSGKVKQGNLTVFDANSFLCQALNIFDVFDAFDTFDISEGSQFNLRYFMGIVPEQEGQGLLHPKTFSQFFRFRLSFMEKSWKYWNLWEFSPLGGARSPDSREKMST